ncbi:MAG: hypothetical protein P4L84_11155 [Isosphaeraceae bacterium]|nr:hypothetical protein [Isosphaeraceae bacterium]
MLHILTNAPRTIRVGDKEYLIGALKLVELGRLQRWIGDHSKCPSDVLRGTLDLIPADERSKAVAEARDADYEWPPAPGTHEGNTILFRDPAGQEFFLKVMFTKHQAVTTEELGQIASHFSVEDFLTLVDIAFGEDDLDPELARAAVRERQKAMRDLQDALLKAQADLQEAAALLFAARAETAGESSSAGSGTTGEECPSTKSES